MEDMEIQENEVFQEPEVCETEEKKSSKKGKIILLILLLAGGATTALVLLGVVLAVVIILLFLPKKSVAVKIPEASISSSYLDTDMHEEDQLAETQPTQAQETEEIPQETAVTTQPTETVETEPTMGWNNPYASLMTGRGEYIFPESHLRPLLAVELKDLSLETLVAGRNEIYARYGYVFNDPDLQEYFSTRAWYKPSVEYGSMSYSSLNKTEKDNIALIELYERRIQGVYMSGSNPYAQYYSRSRNYLFPNSSDWELNESDLYALSIEEAVLGRNEILARRGYTFEDEDLLEYFMQYSWYLPNTAPGDSSTICLNAVEQANVDLLRAVQDRLEKMPDISGLNKQMTYWAEGDAFGVYLPAYWQDYAGIETEGNRIRFMERISQESYGGHLFTLVMCDNPDYTQWPSYQELGYVQDLAGNQWVLVAQFPTDVQAAPGAMALYQEMYECAEDIFATVYMKAGYSFTAA